MNVAFLMISKCQAFDLGIDGKLVYSECSVQGSVHDREREREEGGSGGGVAGERETETSRERERERERRTDKGRQRGVERDVVFRPFK